MEIEVYAHDPLNEGFGFVLAVSFQGTVVERRELSYDEAYFLLGSVLRLTDK